MWHWGFVPVDNVGAPMVWGIDIESFVAEVSQFNSVMYFHNLQHDGWFLIDWMLKHGYTHSRERGSQLSSMTFSTLIDDMGKWFSLTVKWPNGNKTEFRDSLKKINLSIAKIAEVFNLPIAKGEIDYDKPRPVGYEPDDAELDYLERDVRILGTAVKQLKDEGMTRLTAASDSMEEYKKIIGKDRFNSLFPVLSDDIDAEIRKAYRGGFTYLADRFKNKRVRSGLVLDVNGLYPAVMYNELLPYGEPEFVQGKVEPTDKRPLTIFAVTFTAKLKKDHVPCIQIKGTNRFGDTEYLKEIPEPTTLYMTNIDFDLYNDHYDIEVLEWVGGWRFMASVGMFREYIDKWSKIKAESTGGKRQIAKDRLNGLYGKFGSNPDATSKIPTLEDGMVKLKLGAPERKAPIYTALAVFVTSHARNLTIRAAQQNYHTFAYADTDSLHLLQDTIPDTIDVHPTRLGAWKLEYHFVEAMFLRSKRYLEKLADGTYHVAWAGLPQKVQDTITFDDIVDGKVFHGKLKPKTVPGGRVLVPEQYVLKIS